MFVLGLTGDELNTTTTTKEQLQDDLVQALPFSPEVMGGAGRASKVTQQLVAEPSLKLLFPSSLLYDLLFLTL